MKKLTFNLIGLCIAATSFAQTFSTGTITFPSPMTEYSVKIDVTPTLVTLTQIMPSDRWYALNFGGGGSMSSGDLVVFTNTTNISDRLVTAMTTPAADASQDWTTTSNIVNSGVRTVVSTRALNTGEAGDYVFSNSAGSIVLSAARAASATFTLGGHNGTANAIAPKSYGVTLGNNEFEKQSFGMYPNPAKGFLTINMPEGLTSKGELKIYDPLGRMVKKQNISDLTTRVSTADLTSGNYMVVIRTDYGNATKNLIVE